MHCCELKRYCQKYCQNDGYELEDVIVEVEEKLIEVLMRADAVVDTNEQT